MSDDAPAATAAAAAPAATPAKKGRKPKEGGAAKKKASKPTHPPTLEMITKAIAHEKDPKGVSVMAIKKYILAQYKVQPVMLRHMLRRAFDAGLAAGKLTRPKGQGESHLLSGRYRLAGKEPKAKKAEAAPKPKKAPKAKSPAKKPAAAKKPKAKTPKKKPAAAAAKKAKSPKKAKKTPKKPAAKKAPAKKKTPKKAAKKA
ncbi:histone H1-like [Amphibalanus amphitrite]|uniref:histone H1-like n=1 Tax=Amphibalanus amphitrite TaxID=1232801 RepID=UPI001C906199|nr:histone H1-like [Amphibalanus amphitrite]